MTANELIVKMQKAYNVREFAKNAYHKNRSAENAVAYSAALLNWDLVWHDFTEFTA